MVLVTIGQNIKGKVCVYFAYSLCQISTYVGVMQSHYHMISLIYNSNDIIVFYPGQLNIKDGKGATI